MKFEVIDGNFLKNAVNRNITNDANEPIKAANPWKEVIAVPNNINIIQNNNVVIVEENDDRPALDDVDSDGIDAATADATTENDQRAEQPNNRNLGGNRVNGENIQNDNVVEENAEDEAPELITFTQLGPFEEATINVEQLTDYQQAKLMFLAVNLDNNITNFSQAIKIIQDKLTFKKLSNNDLTAALGEGNFARIINVANVVINAEIANQQARINTGNNNQNQNNNIHNNNPVGNIVLRQVNNNNNQNANNQINNLINNVQHQIVIAQINPQNNGQAAELKLQLESLNQINDKFSPANVKKRGEAILLKEQQRQAIANESLKAGHLNDPDLINKKYVAKTSAPRSFIQEQQPPATTEYKQTYSARYDIKDLHKFLGDDSHKMTTHEQANNMGLYSTDANLITILEHFAPAA